MDGDTSQLTSLLANQAHSFSYTVSGKRGTHAFGAVTITAREHFALFRRSRPYNIASKLSVVPDTLELKGVKIRPVRTRGFAGPIPSRQGGSGTDFFGVRAYEPGDPPQWINWRLSARHQQEVYTNVFEQERIADVGLILDARGAAQQRRRQGRFPVRALHPGDCGARRGIPGRRESGRVAGVRTRSRTYLPGFRKQQRQRILRALSRAQVGDSLVFDSLDYLPARFFPAKSQLVLVSLCAQRIHPCWSGAITGVSGTRRQPDPAQFEARGIALVCS